MSGNNMSVDDIVSTILGADLSSEVEELASSESKVQDDEPSEGEKIASLLEQIAVQDEDNITMEMLEEREQEKTAKCARIDDFLETLAQAHGLQK